MNELVSVGIFLAALVGGLLVLAPRVSESLVRWKALRLPPTLSERMREEWLAELDALPGRPSRLAFAIALTLTRRHSFAIEEDSLFATPSRSSLNVATFGGWPSVVTFTTVVVAAIAYGASFLIQPLYRSHMTLEVIPQQIPARFVEPAAVGISLDERLRSLSSIVLSDRGLERVILEFDLYKSERGLRGGKRNNDAAVVRMRRDISVDVKAGGQSFEVVYVSPEPRMALLVTERLASLLIEANISGRYDTRRSAMQFLDAQIKEVRSILLKRTGHTSLSPASDSDAGVRALERESLKTTYRDLLLKKEQALLSAQAEAAQIGEQFKVIEGARLPEAPVSPDRKRLTLLGAVIGFCLGVAMMMAGRDGSLRRLQKMLAQ